MDHDHPFELEWDLDGPAPAPGPPAPPRTSTQWRLPVELRDTQQLPPGTSWPRSLATPTPAQLHALYAGDAPTSARRPVRYATPLERLAASVLDAVLLVVTLGIGWIGWAIVLTGEGQTPARMLLGQRVVRDDDGRPASLQRLFWGRALLGGQVFALTVAATLGAALLLPFRDERRQTVVDKISCCVVVVDL